MVRSLCLVKLAAVAVFLLAGCPLDFTPSQQNTGGGSTNYSHGAGDTSGSDSAVVGQQDSLEERFPGCGEPVNADSMRDRVWELLNNERTRNGLEPLARDAVLEAEAEQYACEMIYYDFFAHENPVTGSTLGDRAAAFEYDYWMIGENLAAGQTSPEQVVTDWMNSPGHRENMLQERYTEVGVGLREGGDYGLYWVLEFGQPQ
jgi:uncharacterized protein YkwD